MKVAIIYNEDLTGVIDKLGVQNREVYRPETVRDVAEALERGGHNVRTIDGNMYVIESLQEFMPRVVDGERPGMVFNMAYGIQGESRYTHIPAMLEMLGTPYVGSGPIGHALALDKVITKIILHKHSVPTPDFWVFRDPGEDMSAVPFPAIVKPVAEAVSFGVSVVHDEAELKDAIDLVVSEFQRPALVERFIRGREFCIGLLGNGNPEAFPVLEIDLGDDPDAIQSEADKRGNPRPKICPADVSDEEAAAMVRLGKEAFRALGLRDFARVDMRLDDDRNVFVLEVNSMASLGSTGSYVYAAGAAGYDFASLVNKMLEVAAVRYFSESVLNSKVDGHIAVKTPLPVRLRSFLRTKQDDFGNFLAKLVNTDSYVRNVDGVNALGDIIGRRLESLGFSKHVFPQAEVGNVLLFRNSGEAEYDVLLVGHLDNPTPFTRHVLYRETVNRLFGTGIWENKGGLAVMVGAFRSLRFARLLKKMKLGVLLTTDNTLQGKVSKDIVREVSKEAKIVLGLSGAALEGTVVTSRSGAAVYECQMQLVGADDADDVVEADARFSALLARLVKISSGSENVIAVLRDVKIESDISTLYARGEASLSVRFNEPGDADGVDKEIRRLVKKAEKGKYRFKITGSVRRTPMVRSGATERLYQTLKEVAGRLDIGVIEEHRWSSSDISQIDPGKPRLDGLGPVGAAPRDGEEYVLRHSVLERAVLLALLLYELKR
ncbi:MAG: ATP-grasp domain-containing protein [Candidatus Coatesbacteria bacterium]|nr:MAG: ATP-grasp domain-containing protein [Candidatus Coatesbacteria bacterium]